MTPTHTEQVQQLFVRHAGLLGGFVASICGDLVLADDILQEVFLVVSTRADSFVIGSDFLAWARAIARLKTLEHLRTRRRERAVLSAEALAAVETALPDAESWQTQREALTRCLERLTPGQRRLADLAYVEGLAPQAIAARLARAANVVHVLLSQMRRALRECVLRRLRVEEW